MCFIYSPFEESRIFSLGWLQSEWSTLDYNMLSNFSNSTAELDTFVNESVATSGVWSVITDSVELVLGSFFPFIDSNLNSVLLLICIFISFFCFSRSFNGIKKISSTIYYYFKIHGNEITHASGLVNFSRIHKPHNYCGYILSVEKYTIKHVYCIPLRFITKHWKCRLHFSNAVIRSVSRKYIVIDRKNVPGRIAHVWLSPPKMRANSYIDLEADQVYVLKSDFKLHDLVDVTLTSKDNKMVTHRGVVTDVLSDFTIIQLSNISASIRYIRIVVKLACASADTSAIQIYYWKAWLFITNRKNVWHSIVIVWIVVYLAYYIAMRLYWLF
jgi:hypothetical protein